MFIFFRLLLAQKQRSSALTKGGCAGTMGSRIKMKIKIITKTIATNKQTEIKTMTEPNETFNLHDLDHDDRENLELLSMEFGDIMVLELFVADDTNNHELRKQYETHAKNHNDKFFQTKLYDSGFDLFVPNSQEKFEWRSDGSHHYCQEFPNDNKSLKIDFKVKCRAVIYNCNGGSKSIRFSGYYMYPRSSLSKTNLRLANSVGIIDSGYRGNLMGMFDVVDKYAKSFNQFDKLLQICSPTLGPVYVILVDQMATDTNRGEKGFGSTSTTGTVGSCTTSLS